MILNFKKWIAFCSVGLSLTCVNVCIADESSNCSDFTNENQCQETGGQCVWDPDNSDCSGAIVKLCGDNNDGAKCEKTKKCKLISSPSGTRCRADCSKMTVDNCLQGSPHCTVSGDKCVANCKDSGMQDRGGEVSWPTH